MVPSARRSSYGRSSTTSTPSECSTGSTAESDHRLAVPVDLEPASASSGSAPRLVGSLAVQVHLELAGLLEQLQLGEVLHRLVRRVVVLVASGKARA
jgi:hypothetical protein